LPPYCVAPSSHPQTRSRVQVPELCPPATVKWGIQSLRYTVQHSTRLRQTKIQIILLPYGYYCWMGCGFESGLEHWCTGFYTLLGVGQNLKWTDPPPKGTTECLGMNFRNQHFVGFLLWGISRRKASALYRT
jgi:hypothetical protein